MAATWRVPFNRAGLVGTELESVREAIANGHISGDGPFARRAEKQLEALLGAPRALLTTSGTHSLELAALLLDIAPGDEVIVPSFTFATTASAFALRGAQIVFGDIRPDTLNLDERRLTDLVTERTRAIVVVHYAGVACEMDAIARVADERGLTIIEDNAHGLFGAYRGRPLGTFGRFAAHSFHETKNVTCGEGGAIVLNNAADVERAEILREKGTDRKRFFRGEVDKYTWVDLGSSYVMSDLLAAFLAAQLEQSSVIQNARRLIWERYDEALRDWSERLGARRPMVPPHCEQAYHMYYVLLPSGELRDALIAELRGQGILAVFHYLPLDVSTMGRRFGRSDGCPVSADISDRLVRLPFYTSMTEREQTAVIDAVTAFAPATTRL
jgi:dTDP-4-amino-4,6-dideoxygalactose transaminase